MGAKMIESEKVNRVYERLVKINYALNTTSDVQNLIALGQSLNVDSGFILYLKREGIIKYNNTRNTYVWNKSIPVTSNPLAVTCYNEYYKVKSDKQNLKRKAVVNKVKSTIKVSKKKTVKTEKYWSLFNGFLKVKKLF